MIVREARLEQYNKGYHTGINSLYTYYCNNPDKIKQLFPHITFYGSVSVQIIVKEHQRIYIYTIDDQDYWISPEENRILETFGIRDKWGYTLGRDYLGSIKLSGFISSSMSEGYEMWLN